MHLVLHQLSNELLSHRSGLLVFASALTAYLLCVSTGFAGEFYRTETRPLAALVFEIIAAALAVIPFLLAASMGIADPPADEEAHFHALPIRPIHLLTAKLLALTTTLLLPLFIARFLALTIVGLGSWSLPMLWDLLSNTPAWLAFGLAIGSLRGDWKRFTTTVVAIVAVNALVILGLEGLREFLRGDSFKTLEDGLEDFTITNLFVPGAITILLLRYFTRWSKTSLLSVFAIMIPATVFLFPVMTRTLVPKEPIQRIAHEAQLTANVTIPSQLFTLTNSTAMRVAHLSYTDLNVVGLTPPNFIQPLSLRSTIKVRAQEGSPSMSIQTSYHNFPGPRAPFTYDVAAPDFMERLILLPRTVPDFKIINPPIGQGDGFTLFTIDEATVAQYPIKKLDLSAELRVQLGTYERIAKLPLKESTRRSIDSGWVRLVRLQPQVAGKTQLLLNEMYVRFLHENDHPFVRLEKIEPSRSPQGLRYILVNTSRREACLPVKRVSYRVQRLHPLSMRSIIIDYSIAVGPEEDQALTDEWLAGAELHVFRKRARGIATVQFTKTDLAIGSIPLIPYPEESQIHYR